MTPVPAGVGKNLNIVMGSNQWKSYPELGKEKELPKNYSFIK